jgi:ABC-type Fe3+ transport system substrate-binding protein
MKRAQGLARVQGAPVTYGLTIPRNAAHKAEAEKLAAFLLGERGQRLFAKRGFHPVNPVRCNPCDGLPMELKSLVQPVSY